MGGGGSTTQKIRQNFNMESINKSIYEELNDTRTESVATQTNLQKISIVVGNNDGWSNYCYAKYRCYNAVINCGFY